MVIALTRGTNPAVRLFYRPGVEFITQQRFQDSCILLLPSRIGLFRVKRGPRWNMEQFCEIPQCVVYDRRSDLQKQTPRRVYP